LRKDNEINPDVLGYIFEKYHCRPVKQAVSADKGMILRAILAN
jgi:hypothetical protein